jgi:hypothetical protein
MTPIAKEVENGKTTWAILLWFAAALAALIALGSSPSDGGNDAEKAGEMVGGFVPAIVFFWIGLRKLRWARRAKRAIERATNRVGTFVLADRDLFAHDDNGISAPDAWTKLSRGHVRMLTALPKAELR